MNVELRTPVPEQAATSEEATIPEGVTQDQITLPEVQECAKDAVSAADETPEDINVSEADEASEDVAFQGDENPQKTDVMSEPVIDGKPKQPFTEGLAGLNQLAQDVENLDQVLLDLTGIVDGQARSRFAQLRESLADLEPSITVIGQVKAGKTSLLNAMIGWPDLLPADVNPWTSVVTSLHLDPQKPGSETSAAFSFFAANEWSNLMAKGGRLGELASRAGASEEVEQLREQLAQMREKSRMRLGRKFELLLGQKHEYQYFDQELIERYVCLGDLIEDDPQVGEIDTQGRFADVTKSADLYLRRPAFPTKLCIRDTPGVNDTFMIREQTTIRAIRESRLCVMVLSAQQALSSVDMALIRMITNIKSREVVIFVNRIDELADPANQIAEIRDSIRQTLKTHRGPEGAQIIFGSAFWANDALSGGHNAPETAVCDALWECADVVSPELYEQKPENQAELLWAMSGLPKFFATVSERIVEGEGRERIENIAHRAMNLAGSIQVAGPKTVAGDLGPALMSPEDLGSRIKELNTQATTEFMRAFDALCQGFYGRLDGAHRNFLDRAIGSLSSHLSKWGDEQVWEYSPDGLRMMLGSANAIFCSRAHKLAKRHYEDAAGQIEVLLKDAFGESAGEINVMSPAVPHLPPPVFLGQTIALDLKGPWWKSWWRKRRNHDALARSFADMIEAETAPIVEELKGSHVTAIETALEHRLTEFFADQRAILANDRRSQSATPKADPEEQAQRLAAAQSVLSQHLPPSLQEIRS